MCGSPQPWCGAGTLPGASTHTHSHTHTVLPRSLRRTAASSTFVVIFLWSRRRCRRHAMQSPLCRPLVFPAAVGECRPAHMHTHTQVHSAPTMHTNTHLTPEEKTPGSLGVVSHAVVFPFFTSSPPRKFQISPVSEVNPLYLDVATAQRTPHSSRPTKKARWRQTPRAAHRPRGQRGNEAPPRQ